MFAKIMRTIDRNDDDFYYWFGRRETVEASCIDEALSVYRNMHHLSHGTELTVLGTGTDMAECEHAAHKEIVIMID